MRILLVMLVLLSAFSAGAQELPQLLLMNTEIGAQPDGFGGETPVVVGDQVFNHGSDAYVNINIFVEALDADDKVIGEGFGYLVDACGTALLDYALPPGRIQTFSAPFEVFAAGEVANVKLSFDAEAVSLESSPTVDAPAGPSDCDGRSRHAGVAGCADADLRRRLRGRCLHRAGMVAL